MIPHGKRHEVLFNKYLAHISLLSAFFFNGKANICYIISAFRASLVAQMLKYLLAMQETGLGKSLGEGNGNPLQYMYQENSMDMGGSLVGYSPWGHKELDTIEGYIDIVSPFKFG